MRLWIQGGILAAFLVISGNAWAVEMTWDQLNTQIIAYHNEKNYAGAFPLAKQALTKAEDQFGKTSEEVSLALNNLAVTAKELGKRQEAVDYYEQSIQVIEERVGTKGGLSQ